MSHNPNIHFDIPLNEKVKSLPGFFGLNLEDQAPYDILKVESNVEIRCYRPQTQARILVKGDFKEAQHEAFNTLAAYIFGDNYIQEKIPLITPVFLEKKEQEWQMSFILPQQFLIRNAPRPNNKKITIHECPLHLSVCISYAGLHSVEKAEEYQEILRKWLHRRPWYIPVGDFKMAQFDGPLTIPFFRKNEIHIEVKHTH